MQRKWIKLGFSCVVMFSFCLAIFFVVWFFVLLFLCWLLYLVHTSLFTSLPFPMYPFCILYICVLNVVECRPQIAKSQKSNVEPSTNQISMMKTKQHKRTTQHEQQKNTTTIQYHKEDTLPTHPSAHSLLFFSHSSLLFPFLTVLIGSSSVFFFVCSCVVCVYVCILTILCIANIKCMNI